MRIIKIFILGLIFYFIFGHNVVFAEVCITQTERQQIEAFNTFDQYGIKYTNNVGYHNTGKPIDENRPNLCGLLGGGCPPTINNAINLVNSDGSVNWEGYQGVQVGNIGQQIYVPPSGRTIGSGMQVLISNITNDSISLQYTLDASFSNNGQAVNRYDLQLKNINVNPSLITAYNNAIKTDGSLPALPAGYVLGTSGANGVIVVMRDTGTPMDLTELNDFWGLGNVNVNPETGEIITLEYNSCYDLPTDSVLSQCKPPIYYTAAPCCQNATATTALTTDGNLIQKLVGQIFGFVNGYYAYIVLKQFENPVTQQTKQNGSLFSSQESVSSTVFYDIGSDFDYNEKCFAFKNCLDDGNNARRMPVSFKLLDPDKLKKFPKLSKKRSYENEQAVTVASKKYFPDAVIAQEPAMEIVNAVAGFMGEQMGVNLTTPAPGSCDSGGCYKINSITLDAQSGKSEVRTTVNGQSGGNACWPGGCNSGYTIVTGGGHGPGGSGAFFAYAGSDPSKSQQVKGLGNYLGTLPENVRDPKNISSHMAWLVDFVPCTGADCYSTSLPTVARSVPVANDDQFIIAQAPNIEFGLQFIGFLANKLWSNPEKIVDVSTPLGLPQQDFLYANKAEQLKHQLSYKQKLWDTYYTKDDANKLAMARAYNTLHEDSFDAIAEIKQTPKITNSIANSDLPFLPTPNIQKIINTDPNSNSACFNPFPNPEEQSCPRESYVNDGVRVQIVYDKGDTSTNPETGERSFDGSTNPKDVDVDVVGVLGGYNGCSRYDPSGFTSPICENIAARTALADDKTQSFPSLTGLMGTLPLGLYNHPREDGETDPYKNNLYNELPVETANDMGMEKKDPTDFGNGARVTTTEVHPQASINRCSTFLLVALEAKPKSEVDINSKYESDIRSKAYYDKTDSMKDCYASEKQQMFDFAPYSL